MEKIKNFNQVSKEILYPIDPSIVSVNQKSVNLLISNSSETERKRMRFCAHPNPNSMTHEMIIVHEKDTYVRPHLHLERPESFHIIYGICDVIVFNHDGSILQVVNMGDFNSRLNFYYRLNESLFHTLLIYSDYLVFHETTQGPFDPANTLFAEWAPVPNDDKEVKQFITDLKTRIEEQKGLPNE